MSASFVPLRVVIEALMSVVARTRTSAGLKFEGGTMAETAVVEVEASVDISVGSVKGVQVEGKAC